MAGKKTFQKLFLSQRSMTLKTLLHNFHFIAILFVISIYVARWRSARRCGW